MLVPMFNFQNNLRFHRLVLLHPYYRGVRSLLAQEAVVDYRGMSPPTINVTLVVDRKHLRQDLTIFKANLHDHRQLQALPIH